MWRWLRTIFDILNRIFGSPFTRRQQQPNVTTTVPKQQEEYHLRSIPHQPSPPLPTASATQSPAPCQAQSEDVSDNESDNLSAFSDEPAVCGCGRALERGWVCTHCRRTCIACGRALVVNEQCDRCHPSS